MENAVESLEFGGRHESRVRLWEEARRALGKVLALGRGGAGYTDAYVRDGEIDGHSHRFLGRGATERAAGPLRQRQRRLARRRARERHRHDEFRNGDLYRTLSASVSAPETEQSAATLQAIH